MTGRPRTPWNRTVIYECHVKGMTMRRTRTCPSAAGHATSGSRASRCSEHLRSLGVTAVELLPVHHASRASRGSRERGLINYWGYNSIGYFAPDARFATRRSAARR